MVGPDADRDFFVLGSMWIDLVAPAAGRPVVPYVVFGGGFMSHRDELGRGPYPWKHEGSFTAGGGARVRVGDRVYVGGDVRIGWELHLRSHRARRRDLAAALRPGRRPVVPSRSAEVSCPGNERRDADLGPGAAAVLSGWGRWPVVPGHELLSEDLGDAHPRTRT